MSEGSPEQLKTEIAALRQQLAAMTAIADVIPHIVWTSGPHGTATYFNKQWTEFTGLDLAQTLAAGGSSFMHPDDLPGFEAERRKAAAERVPCESTYRLRSKDGTYRWHVGRMVPVLGERGEVASWVATATDVHDQRIREDQQRYLIAATKVLGTSLDLRQTLSDVAKLAVPRMADWCSIDLLTEAGTLDRHAVAHVDPSKVELAWDLWKRMPPSPDDPHGVYAVMRTGTPEVTTVTDEMLAAAIQDPEILRIVRDLGLHSAMLVPLSVRDRVLGAVTLVSAESRKAYSTRDLDFATELAQRVSVAVDNASLYGAAERARTAAEAIAADVVEQSRAVEQALVAMRAERDAAVQAQGVAKAARDT